MSMTVKGSLRYGIEHNGKLHYDFEIGLLTMGQSGECLDATESRFGSLDSRQADAFYRAASFAYALRQLGDMTKADITPELLYTQLTQDDADVLEKAVDEVKKKRSEPKSAKLACDSPSSSSVNMA